ncbi:endonuclease [Mucilaginibacter achroorhodeus]|uniref:Endonuclease n=1 Tax=Mucilaginibacter achroorhodeus TaxID=2599294 RepID=A0A563U8P9_9SPHI|nr:DNA-formamidopyrimidine glycosylase family protein [Mucilaginibacter achroorhodeus]TWR27706.1 endonuclease [Mucilaginibacter achroorhodeus]
MPEGPSILILKELVQQFKHKTVAEATCNNKSLDASLLVDKRIIDFKSWGKHFLICFPKFTVRIHMMMFGTYRINTHTAKPPRLGLRFTDDTELNFYACQLQLITEPLDKAYDWQADIMSDHWSSRKAIKKMKADPDLLVCDALMDQHIFSGVGNIIKNEALFNARIHPESLVSALPPKKLTEMINEAVKYSFQFLEQKQAGTLKKNWKAYHKKECPRNHVPIIRKDTGKSHRTSFYCEVCQKLYK